MRLLDSFKVDDDHCVFPALRAGGIGRRHEVTDQTLAPTRLALDDLTRGASRRVRGATRTAARDPERKRCTGRRGLRPTERHQQISMAYCIGN
jgi:hypothetical protein